MTKPPAPKSVYTLRWHLVLWKRSYTASYQLLDKGGETLGYGTLFLPEGLDHTESRAMASVALFRLAAEQDIPNVERT